MVRRVRRRGGVALRAGPRRAGLRARIATRAARARRRSRRARASRAPRGVARAPSPRARRTPRTRASGRRFERGGERAGRGPPEAPRRRRPSSTTRRATATSAREGVAGSRKAPRRETERVAGHPRVAVHVAPSSRCVDAFRPSFWSPSAASHSPRSPVGQIRAPNSRLTSASGARQTRWSRAAGAEGSRAPPGATRSSARTMSPLGRGAPALFSSPALMSALLAFRCAPRRSAPRARTSSRPRSRDRTRSHADRADPPAVAPFPPPSPSLPRPHQRGAIGEGVHALVHHG